MLHMQRVHTASVMLLPSLHDEHRTVDDDGVFQLVLAARNSRRHQAIYIHRPVLSRRVSTAGRPCAKCTLANINSCAVNSV